MHACRSGRTKIDQATNTPLPSFAQRISGHFGITVIAPDERDNFNDKGEMGPYVDQHEDRNGNYTSKDHSRSNTKGHWLVYQNGKLQAAYKGNWVPKGNPSKWDKFWYQIPTDAIPQAKVRKL